MTFKPNLAGTPKSDADIPLPCIASAKIDGVRGSVHPQGLMSRSMKLIPNKFVQKELASKLLHGLDGELVVGSATDPNCMQNTTSGVMSTDKLPDFTYYVFDHFEHGGGFVNRFNQARKQVSLINQLHGKTCRVVLLPHRTINTLEELNVFEAEMLELGYEGVMVRKPDALYKQGRSTPKEGGLLKIKRFVDHEFMIIGFEEQLKNNNEKQINELGRSKRSTRAAGKTGKDTLGALVVRHVAEWNKGAPELGVQFNIGTGMDDKLRAHIWANRTKFMNAVGTYKSFPIGVKDAPRHPVFKSFRAEWDIS